MGGCGEGRAHPGRQRARRGERRGGNGPGRGGSHQHRKAAPALTLGGHPTQPAHCVCAPPPPTPNTHTVTTHTHTHRERGRRRGISGPHRRVQMSATQVTAHTPGPTTLWGRHSSRWGFGGQTRLRRLAPLKQACHHSAEPYGVRCTSESVGGASGTAAPNAGQPAVGWAVSAGRRRPRAGNVPLRVRSSMFAHSRGGLGLVRVVSLLPVWLRGKSLARRPRRGRGWPGGDDRR